MKKVVIRKERYKAETMAYLRFFTSGESHGRALTGILEGVPSGFPVTSEDIDRELRRRQGGHGRGGRMKIESDHAEILSGVRWGHTLGSPISILIENKDWKNWQQGMSVDAAYAGSLQPVTRPRPGHADLAGVLKYNHKDIRNILERSSARETAVRVALGAIAKEILSVFDIRIGSYVVQIGTVSAKQSKIEAMKSEKELWAAFENAENSPVRCPDPEISNKMVKLIDKAAKEGNSLGGIFEVFATGIPVGLGSHVQWDRKLDGRIAQAVMSIQAIKGVEIGLGFEMAKNFGSDVMDEIIYSKQPAEERRAGSHADSMCSGQRFFPNDQQCRRDRRGDLKRHAPGHQGCHETHPYAQETAHVCGYTYKKAIFGCLRAF